MTMRDTAGRRLLARFADALDYPGPGTLAALADCEALLAAARSRVRAPLSSFRRFADETPLGRLQELYTGAFDLDTLSDLDATLYPYVGHHLLGESYKRSRFMLELAERYRAHGFVVTGGELPDHLLVMLRFVAACPDEQLAAEILADAIVPALATMTGNDASEPPPGAPLGGRRAYQQLLRALLYTIEDGTAAPATARAG